MEKKVFNNQILESWLDKKTDEILAKVDREKITTEEMITLILKAQTNHFDHMDGELKADISSVRGELKELRTEMMSMDNGLRGDMKSMEDGIRKDMKSMEAGIRTDMKSMGVRLDAKVDRVDTKIDNRFNWMMGLSAAGFAGLYLKLFLG